MSFTKLYYHLVFATKNRQPIISFEKERSLYAQIFTIAKRYNAEVYRIGGMPDHIHILFSLEPMMSVSKFVQSLKRESSFCAKTIYSNWDGWQEGYGCFSCSYRELEMIVNYIKSQKEHHKVTNFRDEYRQWLIDNGVSPSEPYFPH